jgi:endonuclease YncB( thermonuclease family)
MTTPDEQERSDAQSPDASEHTVKPEQAEPDASSDGDGSWADDPQTQDPDEDRSVDTVIRRTSRG